MMMRSGWNAVFTILLLVGASERVAGAAAPSSDDLDLRKAEELKHRYEALYDKAKYREAAASAQEACSLLQAKLGSHSRKLGECLHNLGVIQRKQGELGKAQSSLKRALRIRKSSLGHGHEDVASVASSLHELATTYEEIGKFEEAQSLYERSIAIKEKVLGAEHPSLAATFNNLAVLHRAKGRPEQARALFERALAITEKSLGAEHPDVAACLSNLAGLLRKQGELVEAAALYKRALAILEKSLGPAHPDVSTCLNNQAALYRELGDDENAVRLLERSLAISEKTLGPVHPSIAATLSNLASIHRDRGMYDESEALFSRALVIRTKALGPDHPDVAMTLNGLALVHENRGNYEEAEMLFGRALSICENAFGLEHPKIATALNNLALVFVERGEFKRAEPLLERALAIKQAQFGPEHPETVAYLSNLASVNELLGKRNDAQLSLQRAVAIQERALGPSHLLLAHSLNNLGTLYAKEGKLTEATSLFERALAIREASLGPENPLVATSLNNLASAYGRGAEHKRAEPLYRRSLAIREKVLGPYHPRVAESLINVAWSHRKLGQHDPAVALQVRAMEIEEENLAGTFGLTEEHRRLLYAQTLSPSVDLALSCHLRMAPGHRSSAEFALATLLRRKGRVLDLSTRTVEAIRRSLPEEHVNLLDELTLARDQYAAVARRAADSSSGATFIDKLAEAQEKQHLQWKQLSEASPTVHALSEPVEIVDVQEEIPPGTVVIEFIRYRLLDHEKTPSYWTVSHYAAYLVFPDRFDWVDLGPAEPIEQHVNAFRKALRLKQPIPTDLHDAVMQPILDRLGNARRLFIAPDADLNLVPFGALYDGERYLVERYDLHYLTTGRDLLRPWDAYGSTTDDTVTIVANPAGASLPGTEHESELLKDLFPHVETLLHDSATETNAQRRAQPWMLHLATHGFFELPEPDPELERRMDEYTLSMSPSALPFAPGRLDNPMLHSGLLLASADASADPAADPDDPHLAPDGRLTAYEISGWDLRGTELVVLSACGTGLGEPRAGEGVLGLRRAFAMAGAQTQVMSLWDVSDATTAELMEAYYRKLLAGKGRAEAMQEVQLEMLRSGKYHPGDWASFVVVGEWRPLSKDKLPKPEGPPPIEPRGCGCQRASVAGEAPPDLLVLALLGSLAIRRRRKRPHA